jgi:adenylate cyclase
VIGLLGEYYEALGAIITQYEATLTCFMGDGLMLLLNAPLPCPDPAMRAVSMALEMQATVQALIVRWRTHGYAIGFGIGIATGEAIVGRIGYEGRIDYTAIGSVVNLASRICAAARDGQVLTDRQTAAAASADPTICIEDVGAWPIRGSPGRCRCSRQSARPGLKLNGPLRRCKPCAGPSRRGSDWPGGTRNPTHKQRQKPRLSRLHIVPPKIVITTMSSVN